MWEIDPGGGGRRGSHVAPKALSFLVGLPRSVEEVSAGVGKCCQVRIPIQERVQVWCAERRFERATSSGRGGSGVPTENSRESWCWVSTGGRPGCHETAGSRPARRPVHDDAPDDAFWSTRATAVAPVRSP